MPKCFHISKRKREKGERPQGLKPSVVWRKKKKNRCYFLDPILGGGGRGSSADIL